MAEAVTFKKYANRRIYDTQRSRYITLEQLAEVIRQGQEVEVIDARTKEDVTALTLTQIVLEQAKRQNALLPVPILHLIIQYGDNVLLEFFETYLHQIVSNYIQYKQAVDDQFKNWLDLGMGLTPTGRGGMPKANPFTAFWKPPTDTDEQDEE
jgi:polyhydroxyalkanoate synthesis repressor PhaR